MIAFVIAVTLYLSYSLFAVRQCSGVTLVVEMAMRYLLGILVTLLAVSSYVYLQEAPFLYLLGILIIVVHAFFFHDPKRQKPECLSQMPGYILLLLLIVGVRYANPVHRVSCHQRANRESGPIEMVGVKDAIP